MCTHTLSLTQDAGIELDPDDLTDICSTIAYLTDPDPTVGLEGDAEGEGEEEEVDDGTCEMCERLTSRTFHHLIPKEV